MPGSPTTPGWAGACDDVPVHVALRDSDHVGTQNFLAFAAPWLAYVLPCRRFADTLTSANARLGPDRYSFTVVDLHIQLFAGFDWRTGILDLSDSRRDGFLEHRTTFILRRFDKRSRLSLISELLNRDEQRVSPATGAAARGPLQDIWPRRLPVLGCNHDAAGDGDDRQ